MWSGDEVSLLLSEVETVEIPHLVKKLTTTSINGNEATLKEMQLAQSASKLQPLSQKKGQTAKTFAKKEKK